MLGASSRNERAGIELGRARREEAGTGTRGVLTPTEDVGDQAGCTRTRWERVEANWGPNNAGDELGTKRRILGTSWGRAGDRLGTTKRGVQSRSELRTNCRRAGAKRSALGASWGQEVCQAGRAEDELAACGDEMGTSWVCEGVQPGRIGDELEKIWRRSQFVPSSYMSIFLHSVSLFADLYRFLSRKRNSPPWIRMQSLSSTCSATHLFP